MDSPEPSDAAPACELGNGYDGTLSGVRISSVFVILIGSLFGAVLPIYLARSKRLNVHPATFFVAKYFGTGVIVSTAIMHLLVPAFEALGNECLGDLEISQYPWAGGICFMTIMVMFLFETVISHYDFFGGSGSGSGDGHSHGLEHSKDPSFAILKGRAASDSSLPARHPDPESGLATRLPGEDHLGHKREHTEHDNLAAQMTGLFILEFGVIFHSIFIGLTLAVAGSEFNVLYIVLVFHQTFEGLGLGSRLATAAWAPGRSWLPYLLAALYALSTPLAIAIGLGVYTTIEPGSATTLIVNGIFDSISAGILLYTGLVELLAHEFMFSPQMRDATLKVKMAALGCVWLGGGLMALLAKWA